MFISNHLYYRSVTLQAHPPASRTRPIHACFICERNDHDETAAAQTKNAGLVYPVT